MEDPVIDPDGHSFERSAIEAWLRINPFSPITRNFLTAADLRPNRALKDSIDKVRDRIASSKGLVADPLGSGTAVPAGRAGSPVLENEGIEIVLARDGNKGLVRLVPPQGNRRVPLDVVCVIDISGSMSAAAELKTSSGVSESFGLSVLDIVKHAMKTIITTLGKDDRIALVTFSDQAKVLMELTSMSDSGRKSAQAVVDGVKAGGSTNLWDGLFNGLEVLRKSPADRRNRAVMLLTDGEPNIVPPRGHLPMLNNYRERHDGLPGVIYTFGFGYRLDSDLLVELAVGGHGTYSFIPDSSLVGTVFIHTLSALLTTVASNVRLRVQSRSGEVVEALGGHQQDESGGALELSFGSILYGQSRDLVFVLPSEAFNPLLIELAYTNVLSGQKVSSAAELNSYDTPIEKTLLEKNLLRFEAIGAVEASASDARINRFSNALSAIAEFSKKAKASPIAKDPVIRDLLKDIDGQVTEALSRDEYYQKWGKHYIPSLLGAHRNQQCNNFKDPGVQHYGGKLFKSLRDEIDATFLKLPPPVPSTPAPPLAAPSSSSGFTFNSTSSQITRAPRRIDMSHYNSSSNPCFAGSCLVTMGDGSIQRVDRIRRGDIVATGLSDCRPGVVRCVVRTRITTGSTSLVHLGGGLLVTPYHPVRYRGQWVFPSQLAEPSLMACDAVYSFLLEDGDFNKSMVINGFECVALAHGLSSDSVVAHAYFGTNRVVRDLERMQGWEQGKVDLVEGCLVRDLDSGLVVGILQTSA